MKNIPKEIYLNLGIPKRVFDITRDDIDFKQLNNVGWSTDKIDDQDLKFVLSDVSQQREQNFKWNNSLVKMFTQIYNGNFNSRIIDPSIFHWSDYHGKKIDEKLKQFRKDCLKLPMFNADV